DIGEPPRHQLAKQGTPLPFRHALADAEDGQVLMAGIANLLVVTPQQHVHQVPDAVALPTAVDRRQGLSRRLGGIPDLYAVDTVVAMATRLGHHYVEVGKQRLAPTAGVLAQRQHSIELVLLDPLVALVTLGIVEHLLEEYPILQPVGRPGIGWQAVASGAPGF